MTTTATSFDARLMQAAREGNVKALFDLAHDDVHHDTNTNTGSAGYGYNLAKALAVATNNDNIQAMAIIIKVFSADIHLAVANPNHTPPSTPLPAIYHARSPRAVMEIFKHHTLLSKRISLSGPKQRQRRAFDYYYTYPNIPHPVEYAIRTGELSVITPLLGIGCWLDNDEIVSCVEWINRLYERTILGQIITRRDVTRILMQNGVDLFPAQHLLKETMVTISI